MFSKPAINIYSQTSYNTYYYNCLGKDKFNKKDETDETDETDEMDDTNEFYKDYEITEELVEKLKQYDSIEFTNEFDSSIDMLPDNIKKIKWSNCYMYLHDINKFPLELEILDMSGILNDDEKPINISFIPNTVKVLKLSSHELINLTNIPLEVEILDIQFNDLVKFKDIIGKLTYLKKLTINENMENTEDCDLTFLPENLEILKIKKDNSKIILTNLPNKLKILELRTYDCDFTLDYLPNSLEKLVITDSCYNKPIDLLPIGLKIFILNSSSFAHPILNLPSEINILGLSINFNSIYQINFPKKLKFLEINSFKSLNYKLELPDGLIHLKISTNLITPDLILPETLEYLKIINPRYNLEKLLSFRLPDKLKYFNLDSKINFNFSNIPDSLETLILSDGFNSVIPKLPVTLKKFVLDNINYEHPLPLKSFNSNLIHLYLRYNNKHNEIPKLPKNLKSLFLNCTINKDFEIPQELIYFGFEPMDIIDNNSLTNTTSNKYKIINKSEFDKISEKIINSMQDSIEIFSTDLDISKYLINKLPKNLKEIGISNRELTNSEFDFQDYFISNGCTNNFKNISFFYVEDGQDMANYYRKIINYFEKINLISPSNNKYYNPDNYDLEKEMNKEF